MKERRTLRIVLLAAVLGLAMGGAAFASPFGSQIDQGIWSGRTSQGLKIHFNVLQSNKGLVVQPTELDFNLVCSATGTEIGAGFFFFGFNIRVDDGGNFGFHLYDELFGTVSFAGTLGDTTGTGTSLVAIPGITKDLGAETCSSGNLTWHASAPGTGTASTTTAFAYRITLTRDKTGHVTESIAQG
jgi:hypothetical protein